MIVLKIIENRRARPVMHELGALVEEGAVIFIGLHNEERRPAESRRQAKVLRHTAYQKTRSHARMFKDPGQQTGGRGFAVGTRNRQHPAVLQYVTCQPFGA